MNLKKIIPTIAIIILISVIIFLLIFIIIPTQNKSGFTEFFFFGDLPKIIQMNEEYDFSFAIHNLEDKNMIYNYSVYLHSNKIGQGYISLDHDETAVINQSFIVKNKSSFSELYSELYFINNLLKTIEINETYDLFFAIHDFEDKNMSYNYSICLISDKLDEGYVCLDRGESAVINQSLVSENILENISIPVSVRLLNKNQEIHFWALLK